MKTKILYTVLALLATHLATAQVLFSENFDNLTIGDLSTDSSGNTSGQNDWYVKMQTSKELSKIIPEANRGNVLATGLSTTNSSGIVEIFRKDLDVLWNNRTPGNNILLVEYDFYMTRTTDVSTNSYFYIDGNIKNLYNSYANVLYSPSKNLDNRTFRASYFNSNTMPHQSFPLGTNGADVYEDFQYDTWVSVKICMDHTTGNIYLYIPILNILSSGSFSHNETLSGLKLTTNMPPYNPQVTNKFDNIRISALKTLPSYLGINDFISSKFNIFPNPVTDVVTITNSENIGIGELTVYDINGKTVKLQEGKTENEVQLDISDISSGTYLLHIQTKEGAAVKKIVKK